MIPAFRFYFLRLETHQWGSGDDGDPFSEGEGLRGLGRRRGAAGMEGSGGDLKARQNDRGTPFTQRRLWVGSYLIVLHPPGPA